MSAKDVKSAGHRPVNWRGMFFDSSMKVLLLLATGSGGLLWYLKGWGAVAESLIEDVILLTGFTPKMAAAFVVAAMVTALIPRTLIANWLGEKSGMKGVAMATGAGSITPGGPMIAFPLVAALSKAGSGRPALIAYLTSWEILGFQRILIWELQFLGVELFTIRWLASVPLPFIAAAISMWLPREPVKDEDKPSPPPSKEGS
ncbi:MAG: hypothetical protein FJX29_10090 [Alphaproteobacteria bacterium]|nr:hypothetical protein [Alphaproteobacteria bacterium]